MNLQPIHKALISVSDKTDIIPLAQALKNYGVEIISTGGTKKTLEEAGIEVTDIQEVTGNPEAFGGRMKTISFNIESALLFDRDKDKEEAEKLAISPIDLVVCNLYPFEKVLTNGGNFDELIENIDIGGPTMIRSAAKNFKYVSVITSPNEYEELISELEQYKGKTTFNFRKKLMAKAFNHTADYDALIAQTMDRENGEKSVRFHFEKGKDLRYGENSHQKATFYKQKGIPNSLYELKFLHGKALSYNNILDISGAVASVKELEKSGVAVVKHSNPCGMTQASNQKMALEKAWQGDPVSAFGSIIAFNERLELDTVKFFNLDAEKAKDRKFIEVIIAPEITPEALEYLQLHKNLRVLEYQPNKLPQNPDYRMLNGTLLAQDYDDKLYDKLEKMTDEDFSTNKELIEFGLKAIKNIKSNAIVIVGEKQGAYYLMGMGAGQPNRLIATKLALSKAKDFIRQDHKGNAEEFENFYRQEIGKAYLISDAFFPFSDNVELAAAEGIKNIVQPGGSIRDKSVIETANKLGLNMIFTGTRHFKH